MARITLAKVKAADKAAAQARYAADRAALLYPGTPAAADAQQAADAATAAHRELATAYHAQHTGNPLAGLVAAFDAERARCEDRTAPQSHAAHQGCPGGLARDCRAPHPRGAR